MFGGLTRPLAAAFVAGAAVTAVLAGPSAALACSGGTSAVSVYSECLPSGGGGKHTGHHAKGGPSPSVNSGGGVVSSTPAVSRRAKKALRHAGKQRRVLAALQLTAPPRMLQAAGPAGATSTPTALGSAFDLGSGPTALLIVLAGTGVLLLLTAGGVHWRRSNRP